MAKVLIIQRAIPHYRVSFFKELYARLNNTGIELSVIYSTGPKEGDPFHTNSSHPWGKRVKCFSLHRGARRITLQLINPLKLDKFDMIIIEQANEHFLNPIIFFLRFIYRYKVAFWGHGKNRQCDSRHSISEALKRYMLNWSDWWFAYTPETTRYLIDRGVPESRITTVNNSTDTASFYAELIRVNELVIAKKKIELDIKSNNIGLFCGSMYAKRGLDFLIAAADEIREKVSDFHLILIGAGSAENLIEEAAHTRDWLHYLGPAYGAEKAVIFSMSKMLLMPGVLGLIVIDSLVSGVPIITVRSDQHGPEIDYLEDGVNGFITEPITTLFAEKAVELFGDEKLYLNLKMNCINSSKKFNMQAMLDNFSCGISRCIAEK